MTTHKDTNEINVPSLEIIEHQGLCFTIMPYGGWFDAYYSSIYIPAIQEAELKPCRADDLYRPSVIINDIWSYTQNARVILADLSGKNPNVFYELGLAHALAKPVILITESMDDIPFDLRALRVLEYNKNEPQWGDILKKKITKSIKEVLNSPQSAVLPAFLSVSPDFKQIKVTEQEKILLELRHEIDNIKDYMLQNQDYRMKSIVTVGEAQAQIIEYLNSGLPKSEIIRRMVSKGVPSDWASDFIDIYDRDPIKSPDF